MKLGEGKCGLLEFGAFKEVAAMETVAQNVAGYGKTLA